MNSRADHISFIRSIRASAARGQVEMVNRIANVSGGDPNTATGPTGLALVQSYNEDSTRAFVKDDAQYSRKSNIGEERSGV